ncbi:MAG: hypothetical protein HQ478_07785 [Chloroflexi bacterium]|nr:hypothetical protein [Chloroflexota bacterium]
MPALIADGRELSADPAFISDGLKYGRIGRGSSPNSAYEMDGYLNCGAV